MRNIYFINDLLLSSVMNDKILLKLSPPGIFLAHSTALKSSLAANSQMLSIPIMFCCWR